MFSYCWFLFQSFGRTWQHLEHPEVATCSSGERINYPPTASCTTMCPRWCDSGGTCAMVIQEGDSSCQRLAPFFTWLGKVARLVLPRMPQGRRMKEQGPFSLNKSQAENPKWFCINSAGETGGRKSRCWSNDRVGFDNIGILQKIDHLELWCWRRLLRVPWTARRSNQSILKRLVLNIHWKDWCWSWNFNPLATWCEELTHLKRPWCWEKLKAGGEGEDKGWDVWMASPTQWTWVWVNSRSWWWTGRPGMLQVVGLQRVVHDWATELNELSWTDF